MKILIIGILLVIQPLYKQEERNWDKMKIVGKWKLIHDEDNEEMEFFENNKCTFNFYSSSDTLTLKGEYFTENRDILMIKIGNATLFDQYFVLNLKKDNFTLKYNKELANYKRIK